MSSPFAEMFGKSKRKNDSGWLRGSQIQYSRKRKLNTTTVSGNMHTGNSWGYVQIAWNCQIEQLLLWCDQFEEVQYVIV